MAQVHFVFVIEAAPDFTNMAKLLLYSLRQNGGAVKEVPVTIVTNGRELKSEDKDVFQSFGDVRIRTMPRIAGTPHANKFNALYAVEESYDLLVYLDCDMVVTGGLGTLMDEIDEQRPYVEALPIGGVGARQVRNYDRLVRRFAPEIGNGASIKDERFPTEYPLYNTGTLVLTRSAVEAIREDALSISYELHEEYLQGSSLPQLFPDSIRRIWDAVWNRLVQHVQGGTGYAHWMTEQLGLALAVLKNGVQAGVLNERYNWTHDESPDGESLPRIYHYMEGIHDLDRANLFRGGWHDTYSSSRSATRRELADLARSFPYS